MVCSSVLRTLVISISSLLSFGSLGEQCPWGGDPGDKSSLLQVKDKNVLCSKAPCKGSSSFPLLKARTNKSLRPEIEKPLPAALLTSVRDRASVPELRFPHSQYNIEFVIVYPSGQSLELPVQIDTGSSSFAALAYNFCINHYEGPCTEDGNADDSYVDGTGWTATICEPESSRIMVGGYGSYPYFGTIFEQNGFFTNCDGALGIAGAGFPWTQSSGTPLQVYPVWWTITQENNLPPVLGMTACKFGSESNGGRLQIGGRDPVYGPSFGSVAVNSDQGYWGVYIERLSVEVQGSITTDLDGSALYGTDSDVQTVVDSGNDVGFSFVESVYNAILSDMSQSLDVLSGMSCITFEDVSVNMPIMTIGFGAVELQFRGEDWFYGSAITQLKGESCIFPGTPSGAQMVYDLHGTNYLAVGQLDKNNNLGQALLEVFYTEFRKTDPPTIEFGPGVICD